MLYSQFLFAPQHVYPAFFLLLPMIHHRFFFVLHLVTIVTDDRRYPKMFFLGKITVAPLKNKNKKKKSQVFVKMISEERIKKSAHKCWI